MTNKYAPIVEKFQGRYSDQLPLGPTLDEAHLDKIEYQLGYPLPEDYREFLRDYAKTRFNNAIFPFLEEGVLTYGSIFMFYGSREERTLADNYFDGRRNFGSIDSEFYPGIDLLRDVPIPITQMDWPEELLPIGTDQGGNEICLALFGLRPGAIFYWRNAPHDDADNLYLVANSFDEFMQLLQPHPEF